MMKRHLPKIYAIVLLLLYLTGEVLLITLPVFSDLDGLISVVEGLLISLIAAPVLHEIGHIVLAGAMKMRTVYSKFFCVKVQKQGSRYLFSLANPFSSDQTQAIPVSGGDMKKRVVWYTLGGLIFEGGVLFLVLSAAIVLSALGIHSAKLWGFVPFISYHFLLNVAPFEYPSGKTDALIYRGLKRGERTEKLMVAIMEIQGRLYAGERYSEIDETAFSFPVVAEDEPLFAVCLDLQYRRALDQGDYEFASFSLKRLASCIEYSSDANAAAKIAAELVYLNALNVDMAQANECSKLCEEYLKSDTPTAKRILATVAFVSGRLEDAKFLKDRAEELLKTEEIVGERLLEEKLLSRLEIE